MRDFYLGMYLFRRDEGNSEMRAFVMALFHCIRIMSSLLDLTKVPDVII